MLHMHIYVIKKSINYTYYIIYKYILLADDKFFCKTQNSGLCSKEEKPHDPINEPSRCNTQEGLLSAAQLGDSDLLGDRAPRTANWASFL